MRFRCLALMSSRVAIALDAEPFVRFGWVACSHVGSAVSLVPRAVAAKQRTISPQTPAEVLAGGSCSSGGRFPSRPEPQTASAGTRSIQEK